jgi:hypothetical protein
MNATQTKGNQMLNIEEIKKLSEVTYISGSCPCYHLEILGKTRKEYCHPEAPGALCRGKGPCQNKTLKVGGVA